jgi:hypothetical protein
LKFKNIILKEKLRNNFINGSEKFPPRKAPCKFMNFMVLGQARSPKTMETLKPEHFLRSFFNLDNFLPK